MNSMTVITTNDGAFRSLECALQRTTNDISLDVETFGLEPYTGTLILAQFGIDDEVYIIDCTKLELKYLTRIIKLIKNLNLVCIGHNIKFDIKYLFTKTSILLENIYDTMLVEAIISGGNNLYSSYKQLVSFYCNENIDKQVRDSFINFDGNVTQEMLLYSTYDIIYLPQIKSKQLELIKETKQGRILDLELKLLPVVANMELNGIGLDVVNWNILLKENEDIKNKLYADICIQIWERFIANKIKFVSALDICNFFGITDKTKSKKEQQYLQSVTEIGFIKDIFLSRFNPGSHTQIKKAFTLFTIDVPSTGEKVLSSYIRNNKLNEAQKTLIHTILNYREQVKKVSSYGDEFVNKLNPITGKLHADFNQIGTRTSRFSSANPNLQNIPRDTRYRQNFIASPDFSMITADYSQQEYRLAGAVSTEPKIIESYKKGIDIHTATAAAIYDVDVKDVTKEQRQIAKSVNFAILYGSSEYGIAFNLDMSVQKAKVLLDKYFQNYKILAKFKMLAEAIIWKQLYSVTPLGRRRIFENKIIFTDGKEAAKYEATVKREGFNHIIQGGSSDMMKLAMIDLYYKNPFGNLFRLVLQVHDEFVAEAHDSILELATQFVIDCMISAGTKLLGDIPTEVSVDVGKSWSKG